MASDSVSSADNGLTVVMESNNGSRSHFYLKDDRVTVGVGYLTCGPLYVSAVRYSVYLLIGANEVIYNVGCRISPGISTRNGVYEIYQGGKL